MFLYIGTSGNHVGAVQVDETGSLIRVLDSTDPVFELPESSSFNFFSNLKSSFSSPVTQWIAKHPKLDLLYAFTSFQSERQAVITTYQINRETGDLTKLGVCDSGGYQAVFASFSPDSSLLVVAHHNDGNLAFFDCTAKANGGVLEIPIKVLSTPEIRPETRTTSYPACLPSLQHFYYAPNGQYLLTADCSSQSRVWTYPVDERGLPKCELPMYNFKVSAIQAFPSAMSTIGSHIMGSPNRIRRVVLHPNGNFLYVLLELHSLIQVFEIDATGKVVPDCLQEIPTTDKAYNSRFVGFGINLAADLMVSPEQDGLWVSNRGYKVGFTGKAGSSLQFLEFQQNGARLDRKRVVQTAGPVGHFTFATTSEGAGLVVGTCQKSPGWVELFQRKGGNSDRDYEKSKEIATGLSISCLSCIPETTGEA